MDTSRLSFLGRDGLELLHDAHAVVIGAGGGGSHIVQQLSHLAAGRITVIDPDVLEISNVNRVVGASYEDVGLPKAYILSRRFAELGSRIIAITESCTSVDSIAAQQSSDIVFGAVDSFAVRNDIEAICRQSLTPYVDIGLTIKIDDDGLVTAAGGQVALSLPGGPCLQCMRIITDERMAEDRLDYAVNAAPDQQVISMNGVLASEAVNVGLELITGFTNRDPIPAYIAYDAILHTLGPHPSFDSNRDCAHYPVAEAGWRVVLPPRRT